MVTTFCLPELIIVARVPWVVEEFGMVQSQEKNPLFIDNGFVIILPSGSVNVIVYEDASTKLESLPIRCTVSPIP